MKAISDKKRAALAAEGVLYPVSTLRQVSLKRTAARVAAGKPILARPTVRYTGPDADTVQCVWDRDEGRCAYCGFAITGNRGVDWSMSHRRPRGRGGDRRPDTNLPSNLVLLHGSGDTACHHQVESHRSEAYLSGQLLHHNDVPSQRAIEHAVHGYVYLTDDGAVTKAPPPVNRGDRVDFGGYWDDESGAA